MKIFIIGLIVVVVVVVGGYFVLRGGSGETSPSPTASANTTMAPTVSVTVSPSTSVSASPSTSAKPSASTTPATVTVSYNGDAGFSPATVTVKKGSTVIFKNAGGSDMWPASGVHPTHLIYPEHGTCFSGVFEGCHVVPGGSVSVKFNMVGTWKYHDHLSTRYTGTVIVTN